MLDNLFEDQIAACIKHNTSLTGATDLKDLKDVSDCISATAEVLSYKKDYHSPYTQSAVEHGKKKE